MPGMTTRHFCTCCREYRPLDQFRRRARDDSRRMNQCRRCHNECERERRRAVKRQEQTDAVDRFARQLKNASSDNQVRQLCALMMHQFGGSVGFAKTWYAQFEQASRTAPGSKRLFDTLLAIMRLGEYCDRSRSVVANKEPELLSDEDLHAGLLEAVEDLIKVHPEIAVAAARRMGWRVIPPGVV